MKVYEYKNCGTCQKAIKFIDAVGLRYERIPIVEQPPTKAELKKMLAFLKAQGLGFQKLFNTSGQLYREQGIAEKIKAGMTEAEAIDLLSANGKLIKRPFVLGSEFGVVGFNEEVWKKLFAR